eukprot:COSAG02_NODE_14276_length_1290_cov_1.555835_1_plen_82_part_10
MLLVRLITSLARFGKLPHEVFVLSHPDDDHLPGHAVIVLNVRFTPSFDKRDSACFEPQVACVMKRGSPVRSDGIDCCTSRDE